MSKSIHFSFKKAFVVLAFVLNLTFVSHGSKKNFKDHTSSNQMEAVHSVRHMARLMRRMLAEETESESNATTVTSSSETPAVTAVTTVSTMTSNPTFITSTNSVLETISEMHRDERTNQTIGSRGSYIGPAYGSKCPRYLPCDVLSVECIDCDIKKHENCKYTEDISVHCKVKPSVNCQGTRDFLRRMNCRYCYQTPPSQHECIQNVTCRVISSPRHRFITTCNVLPNILCLGNREFHKNMVCNWSKGYSWTTALTLSIVLGGFGVDRFYLGMWQEGIGKLFSFGGLGVWTLVDVILIATGYLGPADGSLYIP